MTGYKLLVRWHILHYSWKQHNDMTRKVILDQSTVAFVIARILQATMCWIYIRNLLCESCIILLATDCDRKMTWRPIPANTGVMPRSRRRQERNERLSLPRRKEWANKSIFLRDPTFLLLIIFFPLTYLHLLENKTRSVHHVAWTVWPHYWHGGFHLFWF